MKKNTLLRTLLLGGLIGPVMAMEESLPTPTESGQQPIQTSQIIESEQKSEKPSSGQIELSQSIKSIQLEKISEQSISQQIQEIQKENPVKQQNLIVEQVLKEEEIQEMPVLSDLEKLQAQIQIVAGLNSELNQKNIALESLQSELHNSKSQYSNLTLKTIPSLDEKIQELQGTIDFKETQFIEVSGDNKSLLLQIDQHKQTISSLNDQKDKLSQMIQQLNQTIESKNNDFNAQVALVALMTTKEEEIKQKLGYYQEISFEDQVKNLTAELGNLQNQREAELLEQKNLYQILNNQLVQAQSLFQNVGSELENTKTKLNQTQLTLNQKNRDLQGQLNGNTVLNIELQNTKTALQIKEDAFNQLIQKYEVSQARIQEQDQCISSKYKQIQNYASILSRIQDSVRGIELPMREKSQN